MCDPLKLKRIRYAELNAKQREIYNFQKVAARLADFGFNCIKLSDDWQGADFLAYHKDGERTLKVQLKARVCVYQKYCNKNLYLAFPVGEEWYLIAHDHLLKVIQRTTNWLNTRSWLDKGCYSVSRPSRSLAEALSAWKI